MMRLLKVFTQIATMALLLSMFLCSTTSLAAGNLPITRQFSPSAEAAVTVNAGDNDGYDKDPTNAYLDDANFASDSKSGLDANSTATGPETDKHDYYTYGIGGIPDGSTINGITVRADIQVSKVDNTPFTAIRLSWDTGNNWTAVQQLDTTSTTEVTYTFGGPLDTWGRTWSVSELSDPNFRVQIIGGDINDLESTTDFELDWIPVSVTFTAPWDSHTDPDRDPPPEDTFSAPGSYVYMKGTGFASSNYNVAYYDATPPDGGALTASDDNISVSGDGILNSLYLLNTDPAAIPDTWHALVQPASGYTAFPPTYNEAVGAPATYGLMANDDFEVLAPAIPEFPTVMAGLTVSGLCFGIYYWMRRKLPYVKA